VTDSVEPAWLLVDGIEQARKVLQAPGSLLGLRYRGRLDEAWSALGGYDVVPAELAVPVPLRLDGVGATRALGARLAALVRAGDLLLLSGPLGAGKTALTQGLGAALGVTGRVTSPTFVLARQHRGPLPLVHVDAYRLRNASGRFHLDDLDLDAALQDSVTVVEWGEGLAEQLSDSWLDVVLDRPEPGPDGCEHRLAQVRPHGPRWSLPEPQP